MINPALESNYVRIKTNKYVLKKLKLPDEDYVRRSAAPVIPAAFALPK